jgi:ATP-dependent DNA ligase
VDADQDTHDALVAAGYEGTMIKSLDAPYTSGKRGWAWTKVKLIETTDAVITGFKPGKGKFSKQIGAIVFGQYGEDGTFYTERGACSGMTDVQRLDFTERQEDLIGTVIEISFRTSMPDKKTGLPNYRHPQFERIRWDKTKEECIV